MLKSISLFSGAGGLDLGLHEAFQEQMETVLFVESDKDAQITLRQNLVRSPDTPVLGDITTTDPSKIRRSLGIERDELFLLAGGPPCQAFSTAGMRQSVQSENGKVVDKYFDYLREFRPRFFIFENVRGLLSAALQHRPLHLRNHPKEISGNAEERLGSVMSEYLMPAFKKLGYEVVYGLLNSADYGTAQIRHRLIFIGSRDRELRSGVFRKKTSRPMSTLDLVPSSHHELAPYFPIQKWRTLRDAIADLDPNVGQSETYGYSPERAAIFGQIPPGENWTYVRDNPALFPKGYLRAIMGGAYESGGGKEGYWRRLSWEKPAPTLTTQPQQLSTSLCHPEQTRPLSIREYAAIQDFPESFHFFGSKASRYRQIGNAVPVRLARAIGLTIKSIAARTEHDLSPSSSAGAAERQCG